MSKRIFLGAALALAVFITPLFSKDFTGLFDVVLGDTPASTQDTLAHFGWQKEENFKSINEYKKEKAELYGFLVNCINLKFTNDKLSMITVYFNTPENKIETYNTIKDNLLADYEFVVNKETGSLEKSDYFGTFVSKRKVLVISNPSVSDSDFMISVSDIDLLLDTKPIVNEENVSQDDAK
jgi:hypothetical protein